MQQQNTQRVEASKVPEYIKKAARKAAEFNSNLNRERMEERRAYFDLQTHVRPCPIGPCTPRTACDGRLLSAFLTVTLCQHRDFLSLELEVSLSGTA